MTTTSVAKTRKRPMHRSIPLCLFNRHEPDRHIAQWDGYNFVSECVHCGEAIRREAHRNWKKDWLQDSEQAA